MNNPINNVPFGKEKTKAERLARAAWELEQASKIRASKKPVGWEHLVAAHEKTARAYEALARETEERPQRTHATKSKYSSRQIGGYLKAVREPLGISHNDNYNKATYGITKAEYDEINRAMHAKYGLFPERTTAGVRKALAEG